MAKLGESLVCGVRPTLMSRMKGKTMEKAIQDYAMKVKYMAATMGIPRFEVQVAVSDNEKVKQALKDNVPAYSFAISIGQ